MIRNNKNTFKKICFVCRYSIYLLAGASAEKVGGAEFQQQQLACGLQKKGWEVIFVTEKIDNIVAEELFGIQIIQGLDFSKKGLLGKRFSLYKQLWSALKKADADIYYQRNPGIFSLLILMFCKVFNKRFVIAGASDANFEKGKELNVNSIFDRIELFLGIKYSSQLITQSKYQSYLLEKNYNRKSKIFHNIYSPPKEIDRDIISYRTDVDRRKVLWVGRLVNYKRPELFLELADMLPNFNFILVGASAPGNESLGHLIEDKLRLCSNVSFLGHLPIEQVEEHFDNADYFVNTSPREGFPNTFLQAWSRGIPVLSFVDPDNLIKENNLGICAETVEDMANSLASDSFGAEERLMIYDFFQENFSRDQKMEQFENLLTGR